MIYNTVSSTLKNFTLVAKEEGVLSHRYTITISFPENNTQVCELDQPTTVALAQNILSHQQEGSIKLGDLSVTVVHSRSFFKWLFDLKEIISNLFRPPPIVPYTLQENPHKEEVTKLLANLESVETKADPSAKETILSIKNLANNYINAPLVPLSKPEEIISKLVTQQTQIEFLNQLPSIRSTIAQKTAESIERIYTLFFELEEKEKDALYIDPVLDQDLAIAKEKARTFLESPGSMFEPPRALESELKALKERLGLQLAFLPPLKAKEMLAIKNDPKTSKEQTLLFLKEFLVQEDKRRAEKLRPFMNDFTIAAKYFDNFKSLFTQITNPANYSVSYGRFLEIHTELLTYRPLKPEQIKIITQSLQEKVSSIQSKLIDPSPLDIIATKISTLESVKSIVELDKIIHEINNDLRNFYTKRLEEIFRELRDPVHQLDNPQINSNFLVLNAAIQDFEGHELDRRFSEIEFIDSYVERANEMLKALQNPVQRINSPKIRNSFHELKTAVNRLVQFNNDGLEILGLASEPESINHDLEEKIEGHLLELKNQFSEIKNLGLAIKSEIINHDLDERFEKHFVEFEKSFLEIEKKAMTIKFALQDQLPK